MTSLFELEAQLVESAMSVRTRNDFHSKLASLMDVHKATNKILVKMTRDAGMEPPALLEVADDVNISFSSSGPTKVGKIGFQSLPDELLAQIFKLRRDSGHPMAFPSLMRVCRRWKEVISNDPTLWSKIHVQPTGYYKDIQWWHWYVKRHISKSVECPLDITLDFSGLRGLSEHIDDFLESFLSGKDLLHDEDLENWRIEYHCEDLVSRYMWYFIDIIRLLTGRFPLSSSTSESSESGDDLHGYDLYGYEDEDVSNLFKEDGGEGEDLLIRESAPLAPVTARPQVSKPITDRWRSFHLVIPDFWGNDGTLHSVWALLDRPTPLLAVLCLDFHGMTRNGPPLGNNVLYKTAFPDTSALRELRIDFPVDLKCFTIGRRTVRKLSLRIEWDSFEELNQYTNLECLKLVHTEHRADYPSIAPKLPKLDFARLRHLIITGQILIQYTLAITSPHLEKITLLTTTRLPLLMFESFARVKRLDLVIDQWLTIEEDKTVRPSMSSAYTQQDLIFTEDLLVQCANMEELRVWSNDADPGGELFVRHVTSLVKKGYLRNLRQVTFMWPRTRSRDMETAIEVCSYKFK